MRINTADQIIKIRKSGKILSQVLTELEKYLYSNIQSGVKSEKIDQLAREITYDLGGECAFLGYQGFAGAICISIDDEIVHGLPFGKTLIPSQLIKLDYGVSYQGMITDSAITLSYIDNPDHKTLITATKEALLAAQKILRPGVHVGDISYQIGRTLKSFGVFPIDNLAGHGVGESLHEDPIIDNDGKKHRGPKLILGQSIAIEPIASLGTRTFVLNDDGWTCKSIDNSLASQFEHTYLIVEDGAENITKREQEQI